MTSNGDGPGSSNGLNAADRPFTGDSTDIVSVGELPTEKHTAPQSTGTVTAEKTGCEDGETISSSGDSAEVSPRVESASETNIDNEVNLQPVETRRDAASIMPTATRVSTDPYGNSYPEGGLQAWLVVFGSWMGLLGSLGILNTIGSFQAYLTTHQLKEYSEGTVGWIFGVYAFLTFFCGVQIGPIFDAKGPRLLVIPGSILIIVSMITVGFCTQYWHFMLVLGVINGIGTSLMFTPAIAAVGHWFYRRRGLATGMAATGGSLGGIIFPLMLENLFLKVGFAWATRAVALVCLVVLSMSCLLIRSRLPPQPASRENMLPDFRIFRDPIFALTTAGIYLIEWGLFIPVSYVSSYALAQGLSTSFSYQILAILNVGSCFGRWLPGYIADHIGRFNGLILTVVGCLLTTACLWLPAGHSVALIVIYALSFGFFSGSNISLTPVCVGELCKIENYGRYYATAYTIVSFGYVSFLVNVKKLC
jgi:MFS family permease